MGIRDECGSLIALHRLTDEEVGRRAQLGSYRLFGYSPAVIIYKFSQEAALSPGPHVL